MRMPFDLRLALVEDANVYCADIIEHNFGPSVHLSVNGYQFDYLPALTYERPEYKAALA